MPRYEQLRVWGLAREVVREVHAVATAFTDCGGLGNQLRRAAISIASNIAEGAEKGFDPEFKRFLNIARGSCAEVSAQLAIAGDLALIDQARHQALRAKLDSIARMLHALCARLDPG